MRYGLALAFLVGCAGQLPPPTEADAIRASMRWPGTTVEALAHGRSLYVDHCSGCHRLYRPDRYAPERWPAFVREMSERSKLAEAEAEPVIRYLIVAATASP